MTIAAIRYNNPGNVSLPIKDWSGGGSIVGISGQPGYASFPSMQVGYAAFQQRLTSYINGQGLDTIGALNSRYAQDQGWGASVSRLSGIGINEPLDTSNASQMGALQSAIIRQETGMTPSQLGIFGGNFPTGGSIGGSLEYAPTDTSGGTSADAAGAGGAAVPGGAGIGGNTLGAFGLGGPNMPPATGPAGTQAGDVTAGQGNQIWAVNGPSAQVLNGIWEQQGVTAVTTAGKTQAEATKAAAESQNKTAQANTEALNKTSTANTASITGTLTDVANSAFSNVFDLFGRGAVIAIGVVFLAGAVYLSGTDIGAKVKGALA